MDGAAQLIALAGGDVQRLAGAVAQIHAVLAAAGGAVVAGGDDLVVLDDDGAVAPAQTGGALQNRFGDVQIVIFLVDAFHGRFLHFVENYALLDDEEEEKNIDLAEIAQNTRSRKSYIKKWRKSEFKNDEQIEEELMQIAMEINMFDTMSMNTQVQSELNKQTTEQNIEEEIEGKNYLEKDKLQIEL